MLIILFIYITYLFFNVNSPDFYKEFNSYRVEHNLNNLIIDSTLEKAATQHSLYLALLNEQNISDTFIISHYETRKVNNVKLLYAPLDRIIEYDNALFYFAAENITAIWGEDFTSEQILTNWINSPPHNANLLAKKANRMGLGIIKYEKKGKITVYATLVLTD